jgi:hypothetical protein
MGSVATSCAAIQILCGTRPIPNSPAAGRAHQVRQHVLGVEQENAREIQIMPTVDTPRLHFSCAPSVSIGMGTFPIQIQLSV